MDELSPLPALRRGRYRHYKGGEYTVLGVARHSETHEALVVYQPQRHQDLWARPHAMFVEDVEVAGRREPRFAPLPGGEFDPEPAVQRQLEAYNARDLERFVREYTEDVELFRHRDPTPFLVGRSALAAHYQAHRFSLPALHAQLVGRLVFGNKVIDQERVTGVGETAVDVAAIYEVTPAGIRRAWFVSAG